MLRKGNERSSVPYKRRLTRKTDKRVRGARRASGSSAPTEAPATTPSVPPLPAAPAEVIEAALPTAPAAPRTMNPEEMDRGWWIDKSRPTAVFAKSFACRARLRLRRGQA